MKLNFLGQHEEAGKTKQMTVGIIKGYGKNALQHASPGEKGTHVGC